MPIEGAFDEDLEDGDEPAKPKDESATGLLSAIPATPKAGMANEGMDDSPAHTRIVLAAVLSALLLVGGTALFITKPWDPNAYVTHATEDADTSMDGYPGTITHLTAQDLIEDAEQEAYLEQATQTLRDLESSLEEFSTRAAELEGPLETFVDTGVEPKEDLGESAHDLVSDVKAQADQVASLELKDTELEDRQSFLQLIVSYLTGRVETIAAGWDAYASREANASGVSPRLAVRSALGAGSQGRSLAEWRDLFENSRADLGSKDE